MKNEFVKNFVLFCFLYGMLYLPFFFVNSAQMEPDLNASSLLRIKDNLILFLVLSSQFFLYIYFFTKFAKQNLSLRIIFTPLMIFYCIALFLPPLGSSDLFSYIYQTRVFSEFGENPYTHTYSEHQDDPLFKGLSNKWSGQPSPYGPLFIFIAGTLSVISFDSFFVLVLVFKSFFAGMHFLNVYLLSKITKDFGAIFLFAFNPLMLFEIFFNSHNEVLIIFFILLAILVIYKNISNWLCFASATIFLFAAFFVKASYLVLLPMIWMIGLVVSVKERTLLRFLLLSIGVPVVAIVFSYFSFWEGTETFKRVLSQAQQFNFLISSVFVFFLYIWLVMIEAQNPEIFSALFSRTIFLLFFLWQLWWIFNNTKNIKSKEEQVEMVTIVMIFVLSIFLLTFYTWFLPWYLLPLIVLLVVRFSQANSIFVKLMIFTTTFYGICFYLILD